MKGKVIFGAAAFMMLLSGCGTTTTVYDPSAMKTGIRQEGVVSSEEFREVAIAAVRGAVTSGKFSAFLRKYKKEKNDPDAIPILKLDQVVNDTYDPDLKVSEMMDILNEELLNTGLVDVILAEGSGRTQAIAASRDLEDDENFDQQTVVKRGTLQAARLLLRPKVTSNEVRDGRRKAVTRTFVMELVDLRTGLAMWKFTKQLGFIKEQRIVGW